MAPTSSPRILRVAARLSNRFTLDLVKLGGARQSIIDALLRSAILHANQGHVIRDPELQRRFATLDDDVPDELRRPASMNSVASSLRIPYETVRRHIAAMEEVGVCQVSSRGVVVPSVVTNSPAFRTGCAVQYDMVGGLYHRMRAIGMLDEIASRPPAEDFADPPLRLVGRLTVEYVLRFTEPVLLHIGDVIAGLTLMEMIQANTEQFPDTEGGTDDTGVGGFVPDRLRTPVAASALASRLGVPQETMRRHVANLVRRDLCRRSPNGYIVPAEILARSPFAQFSMDNSANLKRLFAGLSEFGVLAAWDRKESDRQAI